MASENRRWWQRFGPGLLVTAAFMGPGTVLTASVAGARFGGGLLWVLLVAVVAAIVLQEMAARFGLVTRSDLGAGLAGLFPARGARFLVIGLILSAILVGNTAYQAGNFSGAATGLSLLLGGGGKMWVVGSAVIAVLAMASGRFRLIQQVLMVLVALMSIVFLGACFMVWPHLRALPAEAFRPVIPDAGFWAILALLGTTVVPYNLFLHARGVQEKWSEDTPLDEALSDSRWDIAVAVSLGGLLSAAILLTAVATFYRAGNSPEQLGEIAESLAPLVGSGARGLFACGLFAAGLTSAITAPLAAALATSGCLGWGRDWKDLRFRATAVGVALLGVAGALFGGSPKAIILFAQAANGLLLPIIAVLLLVAMNRRSLMKDKVNGWAANLLGALIIALIVVMGLRKLFLVFA